jgi:hypothetical protein
METISKVTRAAADQCVGRERTRWSGPTARLLASIASAWFVVSVHSAAQSPAFTSKVEAVRVDVLVTDRGQPVLGLDPSDFEIEDNGVAQQVDLVSFEQIPLNVILALDMSDSVAGERLENLRAAGTAAISALRKNDQAAIVTFSHVVVRGAALTADLAPVKRALRTRADRARPPSSTARTRRS